MKRLLARLLLVAVAAAASAGCSSDGDRYRDLRLRHPGPEDHASSTSYDGVRRDAETDREIRKHSWDLGWDAIDAISEPDRQ